MRIAAQLHSENPEFHHRAERKPLSVRATFRIRGYEKANADILDLSTTGFKVDSAMSLAEGSEVWLKLPGMEARPAKVMWVSPLYAGCMFHTPIHEAVLEDYVRRHANR